MELYGYLFAQKRQVAVAPLPEVAALAERFAEFFIIYNYGDKESVGGGIVSGWGLSTASLAGAEYAGDCLMKIHH